MFPLCTSVSSSCITYHLQLDLYRRRWWSIVTAEGPSTHQKTWYLVWSHKKRVLAGDTAVPSPAITHLVPHCTKCRHISPLLFYHWFISRRQGRLSQLWFYLILLKLCFIHCHLNRYNIWMIFFICLLYLVPFISGLLSFLVFIFFFLEKIWWQ